MTDPIADMLTRIRNAQMAKRPSLEIPFSKVKMSIIEILSKEGYIGKVEKIGDVRSFILVNLIYNGKKGKINSLKRESKPGHRMYRKADELPKVLNGYGIAIVSTSQGLMTNKEAREKGVGGEVICSVY